MAFNKHQWGLGAMDGGSKNNNIDAILGIILAIFTSIVGLYQVKDSIITKIIQLHSRIDKSKVESIFDFLFYLSALIIILVIATWLLLLISRYIKKSAVMFPGTDRAVLPDKCRVDDLESIYRLARIHFGHRSSSLENIKRLYNYCPDSFWVIRSYGKKKISNEVLGYYIVYSLKVEGVKAIREGYYNGANPIPAHIYTSTKQGKALCVGAVVGNNLAAKGAAVASVTGFVESARQQIVYGKPVNAEGLRFAQAKKMKKIDSDNDAELNYYCYINKEISRA